MPCLFAAVDRAAQGAIHAEVAAIAPVKMSNEIKTDSETTHRNLSTEKEEATATRSPAPTLPMPLRVRKHALCTKSAPPHTEGGRDPCVAQRALITQKKSSNGFKWHCPVQISSYIFFIFHSLIHFPVAFDVFRLPRTT